MNDSLRHPITNTITPLIRGICKYSTMLEVTESVTAGKLAITVSPHTADYPKLCGMQGRQIRSFRALVERMGKMMDIEATIDLVESWRGERDPARTTFTLNDRYDVQETLDLLKEFCAKIWPLGNEIFTLRHQLDGDNLHVSFTPRIEEFAPLIVALENVFYPYVYIRGRKLKMHNGEIPNIEHRTIRTNALPCGKRER
jgi:predicted RNA-binding protein YlqC (UPF0109 family)